MKTTATANRDPLSMLLEPISASRPQGDDLTYSSLIDQIREARRADDPSLTQGAWQTGIKLADWRLVRTLCEQALRNQSKDLQLTAWYTQAVTYLDGLNGLTHGLELLQGLLADYWTNCYPIADGEDQSERIGRIEWLNHQLPIAIQHIPITAPQYGDFNLLQWKESRQVENLGRKDTQAKTDALADGKISAETFDRAATQSGSTFYETLAGAVQQALLTLEQLTSLIDNRFGANAPSLLGLHNALVDYGHLANRLLNETMGHLPTPTAATPPLFSETPPLLAPTTQAFNRIQAIRTLVDIANYFRVNEPHSPVALLVERAARWAEMPMEDWLAAVIKDQSTLDQLRELLDIQPSQVGPT